MINDLKNALVRVSGLHVKSSDLESVVFEYIKLRKNRSINININTANMFAFTAQIEKLNHAVNYINYWYLENKDKY